MTTDMTAGRRGPARPVRVMTGWGLLLLLLGAAVSAAPPAARPAVALQVGCAEQVAAIEAAIARERAAQMAGETTGVTLADFEPVLRACWKEIEPKLPGAEEDCPTAKQVIPEALSWSRQVSLLGLDETFVAEQQRVMEARTNAIANCFNEAFDACVDMKDPMKADEMRGYERELALIGEDGRVDRSKYEKCLRFEVSFESDVEHRLPEVGHLVGVKVRTVVPLQGRYDGSIERAERPLETISLTVQIPTHSAQAGCTLSESRIQPGAPFRVLSLEVDRPERQEGMPPPDVRDFILTIDPGDTREVYSIDCPSDPDTPCPPFVATQEGGVTCQKLGSVARITANASHYALTFNWMHEDERAAGGLTIRGWTVGPGPVLGRKVYQRTRPWADGIVTRTENTTLEIRHTPVR